MADPTLHAPTIQNKVADVSGKMFDFANPTADQSKPTSVISSNAADNHLSSVIKPNASLIEQNIAAQNAKLAADKATQDAQAKTDAEAKAQADERLAKQKADADLVATKAAAVKAAVGGTSATQTGTSAVPQVKSDQPYTDVNGANPSNWRTITGADGTTQVVSRTQNTDGTFTYTPVATNDKTLADAQANMDKTNAEYEQKANDVTNLITNITNGAVPLSAGEQAQVTGLQQSYQNLIQQQIIQNKGTEGLANIRGYQTGAAEYDPTFQVKTIGAIVSAGINKVADLNVKMASAVATLTDTLKKNDIAEIKSAWDVYDAAATKRTNALQKTIDNTQTAIKNAQDNIDKQNTYQLNLAKFKETQSKDAFDNAYKEEELKLKYSGVINDGGVSSSVPAVDLNKGGTGADPVQQKAFLDTLPEATRTTVQSLLNYTGNPANLSTRSVNGQPSQRQVMLELAHKADPTFDESQYAARAAYNKNLQSGTLSQGIISGNKAIAHLAAFADSVSKLNPFGTSSTKLNALAAEVGKPFSPNIQTLTTKAQTESSGLKDELAKFFKGTGASDVKSIDDWSKNLDIHAGPGALKGTVEGAITLLSGQLGALEQQYTSTMGHAPDLGQILQPETMQKLSELKNQGYQVDIPGVLYTDKNAYLSNGGSADALKSAYTALTQANDPANPPTPENVLEYAQLTQ